MTRPLGTVLVTGASGFLGRHVVARLKAEGHEPVTPSRLEMPFADSRLVADYVRALRPDTVLHLAAEAVRSPGIADPGLVGRAVGFVETIVAALNPGARLVVSGTMAEYGTGGVLHEDMPCRPETDYARAKLAASDAALLAGPAIGIDVVVARVFHLYGPGEPSHRLFPAVLAALGAGEPVDLSDGNQRRDVLHVADAAAGLLSLATLPTGTASTRILVNLGTGQAIRIGDVVRWLAACMGRDQALLRFGARARSPGDHDLLVADTRRLAELLGSAPPQRLHAAADLVDLLAGGSP